MSINRWIKNVTPEKVFKCLQGNGMIALKSRIFSLDSRCVKALEKASKQAISETKRDRNTKNSYDLRSKDPVIFMLSLGQDGDAFGEKMISKKKAKKKKYYL